MIHQRTPLWRKYKQNARRQAHSEIISVLLDRRTLGYDTLVLAFQHQDDAGVKDFLHRARGCGFEVQVIRQHGEQAAGQLVLPETNEGAS
jgi:hypothetical protein